MCPRNLTFFNIKSVLSGAALRFSFDNILCYSTTVSYICWYEFVWMKMSSTYVITVPFLIKG